MSEEQPERRARSLTEADIEAIVEVLETRLADRFYKNLGRGVWSLAKRGAIGLIFLIAAYGAYLELGGSAGK